MEVQSEDIISFSFIGLTLSSQEVQTEGVPSPWKQNFSDTELFTFGNYSFADVNLAQPNGCDYWELWE